ncbi:4034_t:CDS:2 [Ambispora gerdemannii]|uniref:4034_t:CDS:1 n=1 Tax=Ambispora gerdemannii TaxID=144530 RepID=A0A9N9D0V1_9GLOM|nr:4034_t:CDS:2 [Ambispora gerdemannii]
MNSYEKGDQLEKEITELFKGSNIELRRISGRPAVNVLLCFRKADWHIQEPGDGGIDHFGGYKGYTIIVQCKNYGEPRSIGPKFLRELEGVLSRYNKCTTIGILIAPSKASFSIRTISRAESSEHIIILTDSINAYSDLVRFVDSRPSYFYINGG